MGERGLVFLLLTRTPLRTKGSVARRRALSNVNPPRGPLHWRTNTTRHGASAFVQVLSTTSPLLCPHRLTVPPWPKRAPVQRSCPGLPAAQSNSAPGAHVDAIYCRLCASSSPKRQCKRAGDVPEHRRTSRARLTALAAAAVLGSFIALC